MSVDVEIDKLNLGDMLKKLEITEALDGILDVDIGLKGQGNSVASLMAGLNGDVVAILGERKMPVAYLNFIGADLTSSVLKLLNPFGEKMERAHINCAVCDFNIKTGMAKSDVIIVDDPRKTLISYGKINLKTEKLDFRIETKPKEGIGTEETDLLYQVLKLQGPERVDTLIHHIFKVGLSIWSEELYKDAFGSEENLEGFIELVKKRNRESK